MTRYTPRIGLSSESEWITGFMVSLDANGTNRLYMGAILAYVCLCSTFTSSIFSASTFSVAAHFGVSVEVATLSTSLYVLGYAFGPLIWGPFSELQGTRYRTN
jgi:MFS family permease